jgi:co-chaperonin GroES (HSP10)
MEANGNHIFVEVIEEDKVNGLYIPPMFKQKNDTCLLGKVHFHGPDAPVKAGEIVAFNKWSDDELRYNGVKLLVIRPGSIFAIK